MSAWEIVSSWAVAIMLAVLLIVWKRVDEERNRRFQESVVERLLAALSGNTMAMHDLKLALNEVKRFMEQVDTRLAAVEQKVARIEGRFDIVFPKGKRDEAPGVF